MDSILTILLEACRVLRGSARLQSRDSAMRAHAILDLAAGTSTSGPLNLGALWYNIARFETTPMVPSPRETSMKSFETQSRAQQPGVGPARRDLAVNLALALAAGLLTLAAVEGLARLIDIRPSSGGPNSIPAWVEEVQLQHDSSWLIPIARGGGLGRYFELFEWDRYRFYRLRPNLEMQMIDFMAPADIRHRTGWRVETNSSGFRDAEFERPPPRPSFRIAAIGDSSTFGWGVDNEVSFVSAAEQRLAAAYPHLDVEVLNLGTPGHSSFQGLVLLREVLDEHDIDAVWFSFGANDRLPTGISEREQYARRASWLGALESVYQSSYAYQIGVEWLNYWRGARDAGDIPMPDPDADLRENVTLSEYKDHLREAARQAQDQDLHFALISSCLDEVGIRAMRQVARKRKVPFVNGLQSMTRRIPELASGNLLAGEVARVVETYGRESLRERGGRGWVLLPDRCHPNRLGHLLMGEAIAMMTSAWISNSVASRE